jgi:hypothetical integral membrane protein (TIGR02206 family)
MTATFAPFGPAHLAAITLTLASPLMLTVIARLDDNGTMTHAINLILATTLVANRLTGLALLLRDNELAMQSLLPMHLCDWAEVATVITLIYPNQWTYELSYFWTLGGTLQAVLTPDLRYGFPHPQFINFFVQHGGTITAVVYLTLALGMRPFPISIARTLAWSAAYFGAAMAVNLMLGTNFGYLHAKPEHPSLMDYMAPWPLYLIELAVLAIILCLIYYLPFFLIDRWRSR